MKKHLLLIKFVPLLLIFIFSCAYYNTLFNAKREFDKGIKIIQKEPEKEKHPQAEKHFKEAIDKCWKLLEIYTDKSKYADDALLYIIKSEYYIGKYGQAKLHVNQFLSKYPQSPFISEANLWNAKLLIKEEKADQGKELLHKSINQTTNSKIKAEAYYELGNLAFEAEEFDQATKFFEKALEEKIDKQYAAFILFYLGESYFRQNRYGEAIERYRKVVNFSPSLDVEYKTRFNLARCYSESGKTEEALKILRKMLTAPRFKNFVPNIKTEIGRIYQKLGELQEAMDYYREVIRDKKPSPGTALASFYLAKVYENEIQNIDSAAFYYGEVKRFYPKFEQLEEAESKHLFLSEMKKIRDSIKNDSRLVFRLENDSYFRDSLYNAQLEDSLMQELKALSQKGDSSALKLADSLKNTLDSLSIGGQDSTKKDTTQQTNDPNAAGETDFRQQLLGGEEDNSTTPPTPPTTPGPNTTDLPKNKLEKRKLPQIKEDLKNNTFHLAEFFLLQVGNYDSALVHYQKFLNIYQDSVLTPKALYSIYYIYSQPDYMDTQMRDSLESLLIRDYPNSAFTIEILRKKGLWKEENQTDSLKILADSLFRQAESFYFNHQLDSALAFYERVAQLDTNLSISAKARYARAWIFEKDLKDVDAAISEYSIIANSYQDPKFVSVATKKISPPPKEVVATVADSSDSSLAIARPDSVFTSETGEFTEETTVTAVSEGGENLPVITDMKAYRQWRRTRARRH